MRQPDAHPRRGRSRRAASPLRFLPIADRGHTLREISVLRNRLTEFDRERAVIARRRDALERAQAEEARPPTGAKVAMASPTAAKIALSQSLFRGRVVSTL